MSTDTGTAQRYAKVPAATGRASWSPKSEHTATAGTVTGRGTSQSAALADLAAVLLAMAGRAGESPALWWDESGRRLWIAFPDAVTGDHLALTVDMSGDVPRITSESSGAGPACRAFAGAAGMTAVTR
jgi:hypothetical protein